MYNLPNCRYKQCILSLFRIDLDCLVCTSCNEPRSRLVECRTEYTLEGQSILERGERTASASKEPG